MRGSLFFCAWSFSFVCALPGYNARPFDALLSKRQSSGNSSAGAPLVDLGYERYRGVANASTGLNTFKGIRYAASPTGRLRWQPPQAPAVNRDEILPSNNLPKRCPQSPPGKLQLQPGFAGNEDCLFLSIYAPANKTNLPVLVWIHGGGYGLGQGDQEMSTIINANNNNFIGVAIQYRLGAFGFLSSDEVQRYGAVNAGLLDQLFALQWVQSYIDLFGGNASQVSISGISAGGGAVMLQSMAFDGFLGDSLFENAIAVSPYLPQQYGYADLVPTQSYYAFASAAGCFTGLPPGSYNDSVFNCLVSKDTDTLQNASAQVSFSGRYGAWAFLPVTDGSFIQERPSQQLLKKKVNGRRMLSSNAANEGPLFTPQNIVTEDDFVSFLRDLFPLFTDDDISPVLLSYPSTNAPVSAGDPNFATSGIGPVTAVNQSTFGTGQQQRADNVYAETTFICPSYWLSEAFTGNGREAYKYQYSVIAAQHGVDSNAIFGPPNPEQGPDLVAAYMAIVGNFVTKNNPSISASLAIGSNGMGTTSNITAPGSVDPKPDQPNAATLWPTYSLANPYLLNLNQTGGTAFSALPVPTTLNITEFRDPGLRNDFTLENAYTWEGGRGARCDFWRSIGSIVPE